MEFKSVLFVPPKASQDLFDKYYTNSPQLKLYIRRIFISDEIDDLLPKYLAFLKVRTFCSRLAQYVVRLLYAVDVQVYSYIYNGGSVLQTSWFPFQSWFSVTHDFVAERSTSSGFKS